MKDLEERRRRTITELVEIITKKHEGLYAIGGKGIPWIVGDARFIARTLAIKEGII